MLKSFFEKRMTEFQVDKAFDGIKQVGTANSAGLFAGAVALNYFRHEHEVFMSIKVATFIYFGGVLMFAVAYMAFISFVQRHQYTAGLSEHHEDLYQADTRFLCARIATALSFSLWLLGNVFAGRALYLLQ
jgi:hypothetical protein